MTFATVDAAVLGGYTAVVGGASGGVFLNAILPRGARVALARQRALLRNSTQ